MGTVSTPTDALVRPCGQPRPDRAPLPPVRREPPLAVALSGGGFRATLSGLGVLRFLADAGLLDRVRHSASVSGGSVANGLFACAYDELRAAGFTRDAFDELVVVPFVRTVSDRSISRGLLSRPWKLLGSTTRTDLLAEAFDTRFFGGRRLADLPTGCRFVVNAADTTTSVRFAFERDLVGDYVLGYVPSGRFTVAQAVAASAAVPGLLAPMELRDVTFPCQDGRTIRLVDGGVYDNMALEAVDHLAGSLLVALNAGGLFVTGAYGRVPVVRDLQLAQSLLYRQSTAVRRRLMVERFRAWEAARERGEQPPEWGRQGVLFGLATTIAPTQEWARANPVTPDPALAFVKTSFDRFPIDLCRQLLHAGWWLTGATLSRYHPQAVDLPVPEWRAPV